MKPLKGFLITLLSFLLFFSVSVLGIAFMLDRTVLNPEFTTAQVDRLDIAALTEGVFTFPEQETPSLFAPATLNKAISDAVKVSEPDIKSQLRNAILVIYDYFLGRNSEFNINISFEAVKRNLKNNLQNAFEKNPPAQISGVSYSSIPANERTKLFNQYFDRLSQGIPSNIALGLNDLDSATIDALSSIRQYIGWLQTGWKLLVAVILVLVILIILIENDLRTSLRNLGINFFIYGAIGFLVDLLFRQFATPNLDLTGLPPVLYIWLSNFINDLLSPLTTFSAVVAMTGVVFFTSSFFFPRKEQSDRQSQKADRFEVQRGRNN